MLKKNSDLLEIIKRRGSTRKYQRKPIPKGIMDKILEAGIWGPSLIRFQPSFFVVIKERKTIQGIADILRKKSDALGVEGRFFVGASSRVIANAPSIILVYNMGFFVKYANIFSTFYQKSAAIAEIEVIAAGIQNMLLVAEQYGIGTCWLDHPLLWEKEVNALIKTDLPLIALLTLGYPDEPAKRAPRKKKAEFIKRIG
ncbi:MAG: nitroreductase family protein [Candidatus Omnitrophica bacterium]|nr:nitroreductase family protein [Candidatus Omnitrophota bacterium]